MCVSLQNLTNKTNGQPPYIYICSNLVYHEFVTSRGGQRKKIQNLPESKNFQKLLLLQQQQQQQQLAFRPAYFKIIITNTAN